MENIYSKLIVDSTFKTTSFQRMKTTNVKLKKYIKKFFIKKLIFVILEYPLGRQLLNFIMILTKIKLKKYMLLINKYLLNCLN